MTPVIRDAQKKSIRSISEAAIQAGNSESIIRKHYLKADSAVTKLETGNEKRRRV